jgi:phosphate-selective porin OprO/OprP
MVRTWLSELRKYVVYSGAALFAAAGVSQAQEALAPLPQAPSSAGDLQAQVAAQQKEIDELKNMIRAGQVKPASAEAADPAKPVDEAEVKKILDSYLKEKDEKKKKEDKEKADLANEEGYKVGTDLKINTSWNPLGGVTFETPNKDFTAHIGYRFQLDDVFWTQNDNIRRPAPAGIGDLQDGAFFRRNRPSFDGTAWEVVEWTCELALEQVQDSVPNFDEMWVGVTKLPFIGSVRIGHLKTPQGLEGDTSSSSKAMTFLERAAYTDAFYENFSTGLWTSNNFFDQRMTYEAEIYRQDNPRTNSAADFGDGAFGYTGRMTFLPIYECEGRQLLHLGVSGTYRDNEPSDTPPGPNVVGGRASEFRARPEMRDAIGDFGTTLAGTTTVLPGDTRRLVDTGVFNSDSTAILGTELLYILGPFSVQAEYAWTRANSSFTRLANGNNGKSLGDPVFDGGYVSVSYFLTGENRTYDKRLGRLGSTYIASPYTPFFGVRGEDGQTHWGTGAWEIAARYSHLDLNSRGINGGIEDGLTLGVNWYLNTNLKIQFDYLHNNRFDLPPGTIPGNVDGLGIRTQFFF